MKTAIIVLIVIAVIISLWFVWWYFASRVERPDSQIIKTIGDIQIHTLPTQIYATVTVNGSETQAPRQAFGILAWFIFGNNTSRSSVAMTAPVISQQVSQPIAMTAPVVSQQVDASSYEVSFLMPKEYTMQTLPIPNDKRIRIHQVNPKTIAVVSFARYATESNIATYRNKLIDWLKQAWISTTGNSYVAQYNDPRTPPTMRTNEIWIEITS